MFTPVKPETAVEIENQFRAAKSIGDFVDATERVTGEMYPHADTDSRHAAMNKFAKAINAALVDALGRDFPLQAIPDVVLLIDDHAGITGSVSGLLQRQQDALIEATTGQEAN